MADGYVFFVNVTKECNVNCTRCYLTEENRANKAILSPDTFRLAMKDEAIAHKVSTIIWQGGEATLIGKKAFLDLIETAKKFCPNARQTLVTNLLSLPNWVVEIAQNHFNSRVESTFAFGEKFTMNGSRERYIEKFAHSLRKAKETGLKCVVNFELNRESFELGTQHFVEFVEKTGHGEWEFDISVDFRSFLSLPLYNELGYPMLHGTITHKMFYQYLKELMTIHDGKLSALGFESSFLMQFKEKDMSNVAFNTSMERQFITINPDGNITTNPLFSDLTHTFLGNVNQQNLVEIINNSKLIGRIRHEIRRKQGCMQCEFLRVCDGGPSHIQMDDGSGLCAGGYTLWKDFQ